MKLTGMWKSATAVPTAPVQVVVEAKVVRTRKTISPMCCEECPGTPGPHCWDEYNCLTAYEQALGQ